MAQPKHLPPLKWAGGKRWLVPYIKPFWHPNQHRRLVEPFCGGLAVALGLQPRKALLNDINPHLINFFKWVKEGLTIDIPVANDKTLYYQYRERFNELIKNGAQNSREAAQLFYYLNRTGYNGLCRFNKKGFFNVPFGKYKQINYTRDFSPYQPLLLNWDFLSQDFEKIKLEENDFVYADPPYDVEFTQYAKDGFTFKTQIRLATWLARHPGPVIASNQATQRIIDLYQDLGFTLTFLDAPRMISSNGDRTPAREIFALKNL